MTSKPSQYRPQYRRAVGLSYQDDGYQENAQAVPLVELKGEQLMADQLVKIARRFGIPVVEKPELAQALGSLEVDQEIPASLYEPVAIVLNQVERALGKKRR